MSLLITVCTKTTNFEENEVNFSADLETNSIKKTEKLKQKKLPIESSDSDNIAERQRLINYIFGEGYDKRNYPTNMTVQFGVAIIKLEIVSEMFIKTT